MFWVGEYPPIHHRTQSGSQKTRIMNYLKIESVVSTDESGALLTDKNTNPYRKVVYSPFEMLFGKEVVSNGRESVTRMIFKQDGIGSLAKGDLCRGEIKRFETSAPYEFTDADGVKRIATSKTVVVLNGESAVAVANNALRDNGVTVIDGDVITTYTPAAKKLVGAGQDLKEKK